MRGILRSVGVAALSLYFTQQLIPAIRILDLSHFMIVSGLVFLANYFVGPVTKILFFLPINLIIVNLIYVLANYLVLFFSSSSFEEVEIEAFDFSGLSQVGVTIDALNLTPVQTTIVAAFLISTLSGIFRWLTD